MARVALRRTAMATMEDLNMKVSMIQARIRVMKGGRWGKPSYYAFVLIPGTRVQRADQSASSNLPKSNEVD